MDDARRETLQVLLRRNPDGPTFFHSAATCLHVPTRLTRESTKHEARKRRASVRPRVGCCEELAGVNSRGKCNGS